MVKNQVQSAALILAIVLLGQSSASIAHAANSVGKTCTKIGKVSKTSAGVQLTCDKSGKKLLWKKKSIVVAPVIPAVTDLSTTASLTPKNLFADAAKCKITDATPQGISSLGFPRTLPSKNGKDSFKAIVIPVAFKDADYSSVDLEYLKENIETVSKFYASQSYGSTKIEFTVPDKDNWVYFDDQRSDHGLTVYVPQQTKEPFVRQVLDKTSSSLNIGTFDLVVIETGRWAGSGNGEGFASRNFPTPSGSAKSVILEVGSSVGFWSVIAHEIGHALFGFEDLYSFSAVRASKYAFEATKGWDLMSNAGSSQIELFGWERFLVSWIIDNQVSCLSSTGNYVIFLEPLSDFTGRNKLLMVPFEPGVILVAESRKNSTYDRDLNPGGTLVYLVDTRINHGSEPITVLGFLEKGDSLIYKNVELTSIDSNSTGELVSVKIS